MTVPMAKILAVQVVLEQRLEEQAVTIARLMDRVAVLERGPVPVPVRAARRNEKLTDRAGRDILNDYLARAAMEFRLPVALLTSKDRSHPVAHARQWVMAEAHQAGLSRSMISRLLRLDPTTVLHGLRAEYARRGWIEAGVAA